MTSSVRTLAFACALAIAQPALAWDYFVKGTGIYAGHQTGQANTAGDAAIAFACTRSAPGRIMFEVYTNPSDPSGRRRDRHPHHRRWRGVFDWRHDGGRGRRANGA